MIYKEHTLASELQDSLISEYNPKWVKNTNKEVIKEKIVEKIQKKEKLSWDNF